MSAPDNIGKVRNRFGLLQGQPNHSTPSISLDPSVKHVADTANSQALQRLSSTNLSNSSVKNFLFRSVVDATKLVAAVGAGSIRGFLQTLSAMNEEGAPLAIQMLILATLLGSGKKGALTSFETYLPQETLQTLKNTPVVGTGINITEFFMNGRPSFWFCAALAKTPIAHDLLHDISHKTPLHSHLTAADEAIALTSSIENLAFKKGLVKDKRDSTACIEVAAKVSSWITSIATAFLIGELISYGISSQEYTTQGFFNYFRHHVSHDVINPFYTHVITPITSSMGYTSSST